MEDANTAMSFLNVTWEYVASQGIRLDLQPKVRREFVSCLAALPFIHTFLGAEIEPVITASDGSHRGGAVGIARELSAEGEDFVRHALGSGSTKESGIFILSLFNGIGGGVPLL